MFRLGLGAKTTLLGLGEDVLFDLLSQHGEIRPLSRRRERSKLS